MILRLLQMASFNGKMSALNEINQLIATFTQQPKPEWVTPAVITVRTLDIFIIKHERNYLSLELSFGWMLYIFAFTVLIPEIHNARSSI